MPNKAEIYDHSFSRLLVKHLTINKITYNTKIKPKQPNNNVKLCAHGNKKVKASILKRVSWNNNIVSNSLDSNVTYLKMWHDIATKNMTQYIGPKYVSTIFILLKNT